jgi:hypothetical protein
MSVTDVEINPLLAHAARQYAESIHYMVGLCDRNVRHVLDCEKGTEIDWALVH